MPPPEWLRAEALSALGAHGDPRALDALVRADLSLALDVAGWEGTGGRVRAHRALLGLDAASLGRVCATPAVHDALAAALAAALARYRDEVAHALAELCTYWNGTVEGAAGYRGAAPRVLSRDAPEDLRAALAAFLRAAGDDALAETAAGLVLAVTPAAARRAVVVKATRAHRAALEAALRALLEEPGGGLPHIEWRVPR